MGLDFHEKWINYRDQLFAFLIKNYYPRKNMEEDYPGFFELTPTEQWFLEEVNLAAKRFRMRYDELYFKIGRGIIYSISSKNKIISR